MVDLPLVRYPCSRHFLYWCVPWYDSVGAVVIFTPLCFVSSSRTQANSRENVEGPPAPPLRTLKPSCALMADVQFLDCAWTLKHDLLSVEEWKVSLGNLVTSSAAKLVWNFSFAVWAVLRRGQRPPFMHADEAGKAAKLVVLAQQAALEDDHASRGSSARSRSS